MADIPDQMTNGHSKKEKKIHGKLLCCFDGTGNQYGGDTSDTNIVKLYQKFDRNAPGQFHYYQRRSSSILPTSKHVVNVADS